MIRGNGCGIATVVGRHLCLVHGSLNFNPIKLKSLFPNSVNRSINQITLPTAYILPVALRGHYRRIESHWA